MNVPLSMFSRWRALHDERLEEAVEALGSVPGVRGLVLGGSMGRGEHWPMSDIDLLPISAVGVDTQAEIARHHARLVNWWMASGRTQTLDVGWLCFTDQEVMQAVGTGPAYAAERMPDRRWFYGFDKSYGGRGIADPDGIAAAFATWVTAMRFEPLVIEARVRTWKALVHKEKSRAVRARENKDLIEATLAIRESARALRLVLLEGWGERLGSMGREWTRFERMATTHGAQNLANRLAHLADSHPDDAPERTTVAPIWLQERINLTYAARKAVDEKVTEAENARDQLAAFAVHVPKYQPQPWGNWIRIPTPDIKKKLKVLDTLVTEICG